MNIFVVWAKKNPAKTRGGAIKDVRGMGAEKLTLNNPLRVGLEVKQGFYLAVILPLSNSRVF